MTDRSPPVRAHGPALCKYTGRMPQYNTPTGKICKAVLIPALSLIDKHTWFVNAHFFTACFNICKTLCNKTNRGLAWGWWPYIHIYHLQYIATICFWSPCLPCIWLICNYCTIYINSLTWWITVLLLVSVLCKNIYAVEWIRTHPLSAWESNWP